MRCTCCKKELAVGDWFCVRKNHKNISLPFCSFNCLGSYFTEWTSKVTQELLNKTSDIRDNDQERQSEILKDGQW